jgi:hypothetical protein
MYFIKSISSSAGDHSIIHLLFCRVLLSFSGAEISINVGHAPTKLSPAPPDCHSSKRNDLRGAGGWGLKIGVLGFIVFN